MTNRAAVVLLAMALAVPRAARADSAASKNNEGNRLYERRQLDEALKMYTDAEASRPFAPELHYNIGNVLYRKGELDKAIEEYERAKASGAPGLRQAAAYNSGNALLRAGKLQEAVGAYVQALRGRPDDRDAKRNLELALRLLEEKKKQQQQPQSNPKDDQKRPPPQGQPPQPSNGQPQQGQSAPQPRPGSMSEDEARRILDALNDQQKEDLKKHVQATAPREQTPEEDW